MKDLKVLTDFLEKVPSIKKTIAGEINDEGFWWVKFSIDTKHELAWSVVQEIAHVANHISESDRLPSAFYPVSPAPYMNGGPRDFLSWIIENKVKDFKPRTLKEWLEARMPNPLNDLGRWETD